MTYVLVENGSISQIGLPSDSSLVGLSDEELKTLGWLKLEATCPEPVDTNTTKIVSCLEIQDDKVVTVHTEQPLPTRAIQDQIDVFSSILIEKEIITEEALMQAIMEKVVSSEK